MKIVKPQKLALLTRPYEHRRTYYLGVSALLFVPLSKEEALFSEASLWKFAATELPPDAVLDAAIPKAAPEYLVIGRAYAPGGVPCGQCTVRTKLGSREKNLLVSGDRFWKTVGATEPRPFTEMPLDWAHAFGGEGFPRNPAGKGFPTPEGPEPRPLPNVEVAYRPPLDRGDTPEPAGLGPIDLTWPQRLPKAGTHDQRWLEEDFPGFARDIDWRFFNVAPPDQQLDAPLRGDEPFVFENLHPSLQRIEGRLPSFRARCYLNRRERGEERFEEVPLGLGTVWFFPYAERAVLVFQGSTSVLEDDASDVLQAVAAVERLGEEKGEAHYRTVLTQRLDKEKGHLFALREGDLLPLGLDPTNPEVEADRALFSSEGLLRKNLRKKAEREFQKARDIVAAYGLDPDLHAPALPPEEEEPSPPLEQLPDYLEQQVARAEEQRKDTERRVAEQEKDLAEVFSRLGMDFETVKAERSQEKVGPPKAQAAELNRMLVDLVAQCRAVGVPSDELDEMLASAEIQERWKQAEQSQKDAYRLMAHLQAPAPGLAEDRAAPVRASVIAHHASGDSFAGMDLTGADLSGLELSGASFEGTFLESANLTGANLSGANLRGAVLAHAILAQTRLEGAACAGANLGGASLTGVHAEGADFTDAILARADLTGGRFLGARFTGADCSSAVFRETDLGGAEAKGLTLLDSDLKGVRLAGAKLDGSTLLRVDVSGVDFSGSSLAEAVFLSSRGAGARFRGAKLTELRLVEACDFEGADFSEAELSGANLRESLLSRSDFSGATLDKSDLSGCDLRGSRFYRAVARDARFVKADLTGATLISLNGLGASFSGADLTGTDLTGSNLFGADLSRVKTDSATNLSGALTKKARFLPKRPA